MGFPPDFLDALRGRITLSGVVGRRVRLVKKGRQFQGLCPFHNEKSPSFFVNDDRASYHCFGCGEHGDAIGFLMKTEGLGFPEAVERLAGEVGLDLPKEDRADAQATSQRQALLAACETACAWFETALAAPEGRAALTYLSGRGVTPEDMKKFRLGWAPDKRGALKTHLAKQGVSEEIMLAAGLILRPDDRPESYDRFRGRVMFPIADGRGRIIAFGGRTLGDGQPKYLNSPETPLFSKGRTLYAQHLARAATAKARPPDGAPPALIVEGYLDVIALHRAGFETAMAPLGTALTEEQLAQLWKLSPEPILCFDGDRAGQAAAGRAALRALPLAGAGQSLRFAHLPPGQDPDDILKTASGVATIRAALQTAKALSDVIWEAEAAAGPLDTPERQADFRRRWSERVRAITDPATREFYERDYKQRERALFRAPPTPARAARGSNSRSTAPATGWVEIRPPRRSFGTPERRFEKTVSPDDARGANQISQRLIGCDILGLLLAQPILVEDHLDILSALSFDQGPLDRLLAAILSEVGRFPGLDARELDVQLVRDGLGPTLKLVRRQAASLRGFVGAEGDFDRFARERVGELIECLVAGTVESERREAPAPAVDENDVQRRIGLAVRAEVAAAEAIAESAGDATVAEKAVG